MHSNDPDFVARAAAWENLALDKRYRELVDVAIRDKLDLDRRYDGASPEIEHVLNMIQLGIEQSSAKTRKLGEECSFCGQTPPAVRLGAGRSAFICDQCVALFAEAFEIGAKAYGGRQ